MLLRRVIEHVKSENWFAVFIDFVIVVIGVFIGIQVSNWNEQRVTQQRAKALTERLTTDFGVDAWTAYSMLRYHEDVFDSALRVLRDLTGQEPLPAEELLIAAFRATQFTRFVPSSLTYDELVATGGLEFVANSDLGSVAALFYGSTMLDDIEADGKSSDYRHLFRSITPVDVQLAVGEACGDRLQSVQDVLDGVSGIGYPCTVDLPAAQLAEAAAALRQRPEVVEALQHRIATLATQNADMGVVIERMAPYRASPEVLARRAGLAHF